jgi:hypothetical protein
METYRLSFVFWLSLLDTRLSSQPQRLSSEFEPLLMNPLLSGSRTPDRSPANQYSSDALPARRSRFRVRDVNIGCGQYSGRGMRMPRSRSVLLHGGKELVWRCRASSDAFCSVPRGGLDALLTCSPEVPWDGHILELNRSRQGHFPYV